jgi:hypothetical protein
MADYSPWPLWGPNGLLGEDDLPLSSQLRDELKAWLNAYFPYPRPDWPLWRPTDPSQDEDEWLREGERLRAEIEKELGDSYAVEFVR